MRLLEWQPNVLTFGDPVVWLDVTKADSCWRLADHLYIESGAPDHQHKYERFGEWIANDPEWIEMPHVSFRDGQLGFSDGRHRFAWLRDHGVSVIPVTINPVEAAALTEAAGSTERQSRLLG